MFYGVRQPLCFVVKLGSRPQPASRKRPVAAGQVLTTWALDSFLISQLCCAQGCSLLLTLLCTFAPVVAVDGCCLPAVIGAEGDRIVASHAASNLRLRHNDLACLRAPAWLSDECVNFYMALLQVCELEVDATAASGQCSAVL